MSYTIFYTSICVKTILTWRVNRPSLVSCRGLFTLPTTPSFCCKKHAFSVLILHKIYSICAIEQSTSSWQIYTGIILCSTNVIYEPFYCFFVSFGGVILHVYIHILLVIIYYVPCVQVGITG